MGSSPSVFKNRIDEIREGALKDLLDKINEHEKAFKERAALYNEYMNVEESGEALDKFRTDLLKHLAGSIVVKEHKIRYQKEQFDRFISSSNLPDFRREMEPMSEFAKSYAQMIEAQINTSFAWRCPKIEANYDDFGEKTIRPLNATIFYYFFSANRMSKTWAQWMLSAVRYPNDRVRRAYMRFFA